MKNAEGRARDSIDYPTLEGMTEQELARLRQAVDRLMDAQQEAVGACQEALETQGPLGVDVEMSLEDEDAPALETGAHLEAVLEDILAILQGALEDVAAILERGVE